jgi:hypothetical protein
MPTPITNGIATARAAIPELRDELRLAIIQEQITGLLVQAYQFEAALVALPAGDGQAQAIGASLERTRAILAGYRAQEAALLAVLS